MGVDPISHLDDGRVSPFEVLESLDATIRLARLAMVEQLSTLMHDAKGDAGEQYLVEALSHLWLARESLVASVEAE